mmetsp:Transcript_23207/g.37239  ORF Transcript_23207/g.37239 Transcript_23207/m.37239 type:complete len:161 (-) Transcript_23207:365-847(-)
MVSTTWVAAMIRMAGYTTGGVQKMCCRSKSAPTASRSTIRTFLLTAKTSTAISHWPKTSPTTAGSRSRTKRFCSWSKARASQLLSPISSSFSCRGDRHGARCSAKKTQRLALEDDVHAPDKFRVNGPLTQFAEFSNAWKCTDKALMAPPNRCGLGYGPVW